MYLRETEGAVNICRWPEIALDGATQPWVAAVSWWGRPWKGEDVEARLGAHLVCGANRLPRYA